jgi:hypothetical protein
VVWQCEAESLDRFSQVERGVFVNPDAATQQLIDTLHTGAVEGRREIYEVIVSRRGCGRPATRPDGWESRGLLWAIALGHGALGVAPKPRHDLRSLSASFRRWAFLRRKTDDAFKNKGNLLWNASKTPSAS